MAQMRSEGRQEGNRDVFVLIPSPLVGPLTWDLVADELRSLLAVLEQPTPQMQRLRTLRCDDGHYPTRRTFERRLKAIPDTLPAQIGCLGRTRVAQIQP